MHIITKRLHKSKFTDAILVIIALIIIVSLYFIFYRVPKDIDLVVKVDQNTRNPLWLFNLLQPGMKETDTLGRVSAQVVKVGKYDIRPDSPTVYLTLKLKTVYSPATKVYTYKGKKITIGAVLNLILNQIDINAVVMNLGDDKVKYPTQKLVLKTRMLRPSDNSSNETFGYMDFYVDNINVGDEVKDYEGNVVLTIKDKKVEAADRFITTQNGDLVKRKDLFRKDIYLTLEVLVYKIGNRYFFFDNIPVLIGEGIPIHLTKLSIHPIVIGIEEAK